MKIYPRLIGLDPLLKNQTIMLIALWVIQSLAHFWQHVTSWLVDMETVLKAAGGVIPFPKR